MNSSPLELLTPQSTPFIEESGFTEYRKNIDHNGATVPVLIRKSHNDSDKLLVLYNGAIQRSKAPDGVVFQRSSWLNEINANVVAFADPALVANTRLQIGWGQINSSNWAIPSYQTILTYIREAFSLPNSGDTIHYGSSAGGFQAAAMATFDKQSRALVNNPQLDWSRYNPVFVKALLRDAFDGEPIEKIRKQYPWRVNIHALFEKLEYIPKLEIFSNLASQNDYEKQLLPFLDEVHSSAITNKTPRISVSLYKDPILGHNPLSKPQTLKILNEALGGEKSNLT